MALPGAGGRIDNPPQAQPAPRAYQISRDTSPVPILCATSSAVTRTMYLPGGRKAGTTSSPQCSPWPRRSSAAAPAALRRSRAVMVRGLPVSLRGNAKGFAGVHARLFQAGAQHGACGWRSRNSWTLAVYVAVAIAQNQPHLVFSVGHLDRREEARLPGVFLLQVAQRLVSRKETARSPTRWIRRLSGAAPDRPAGCTRGRNNARGTARKLVYGSHELVLLGKPDDLVDGGAVLAFARDLVQ